MTPLRIPRPATALAILVAILVALAWTRGIDHDESQYVTAARLTANGLLPYRDYAYLQTPLQPFLFAPVAWVLDLPGWTWPGLRVANALCAAIAVTATWRAMRVASVSQRTATICAALFAATDILLFSAGTARNDALPAALFALALPAMLRAETGETTPRAAMLAGLLLAAAAAAKVSYALPAATYGIYAIAVRRHRPLWVAIGALPVVAFTGWLAWEAPGGFVFGTLTFPTEAPAEYYVATGRAWKLSAAAKAVDLLKFLALGPALLAIVAITIRRGRRPSLAGLLFAAGLISAVLPSPTWRQYLLPALPPLFLLLAMRWQALAPSRGWQAAFAVFAVAGLIPSVVASLTSAGMDTARRESRALAATSAQGRVATLSPQFLPAGLTPDPRFATGPFYFRSCDLVPAADEARLQLVSHARLDTLASDPPDFILVGGEGRWTSGEDALDAQLERWAQANGWVRIPTARRLRLYAPPAALRSISPR
ncbi:DUF2029 domain-containing protein [Sphingomonas sp. RS2018]